MRIAILLTSVLLVAGCVSVPDDLEGASVASGPAAVADPFNGLGDPLVVDHDHSDLAAHDLVTPSMTKLAQTAFEGVSAPSAAFGEADLLGDSHLVVAGFLGTGFYIVDVSDPAAPTTVSWTPVPGSIADIKASKSGNFVFVGRQLHGFQGVEAYYVGVRERPVFAGAFPVYGTPLGGCHMLAVHLDRLYCAPNDATVRIFQITEAGPAVALVPLGAYAPLDAPAAPVVAGESANSEFTHDMTVQDDPITGEPVMYVSFWNYGLRVVDVSNAEAPVELGAWMGEGAEEWGTYEGAIHTAMGGLVDGKRIVVVVPEYASVPSVTFLDATDYAAIRAVGVWAPKTAEELGDSARTFSTHNFQFLDGKVYLAMYHGGVWVVDASDAEKLARPLPVGYYIPSTPGVLATAGAAGSPSVWDVLVKDGVILAIDMPSGLHALQFEGDAGKVGLTSFA